MPKYLIEFTRKNSSAVVEYNDEGLLIGVQVEAGPEFKIEQFKAFYLRAPWREYMINAELAKVDGVKVSIVPEDLSFDRFWSQYDYKHGKKARVEKAWKLLPDAEKIKALNHIKHYDMWLASKGSIEKQYPETFINSQRWNN